MNDQFPFVEVPDDLRKYVGDPDPGTRIFRIYGPKEGTAVWFDAVLDICGEGGAVSPGGASMYARVSRPGVHKRLKEGRLTGFFFHVIVPGRIFKNSKRLDEGGRPYGYIPVCEIKAWNEELKSRPSRSVDNGDGNWNDDFLLAPKDWKKKLEED